MTVVSYLKLSKQAGIGCSDERWSNGQRGYDIGTKMYRLGSLPATIGTTGWVSLFHKVMEIASCDRTFSETVASLQQTYDMVRKEHILESVLTKYGLEWHDYRAGRIEANLKRTIDDLIQKPESFPLGLGIGGFDTAANEFKIRVLTTPGILNFYDKICSIGSGWELAEHAMAQDVTYMPAGERDTIELYKGARIIMNAMQQSWRGYGVGGGTSVVSIQGEEFCQLDRCDSTFLNNLLTLEKKSLLERSYVDSAFQRIFHDKAHAGDILPETLEKLGDNANRLLAELLFQ